MPLPMLTQLMQDYVNCKQLQQLEGIKDTQIKGVRFFRKSAGYPRMPMLHESGIIFMGQGHKHIYTQSGIVRYGVGDCLIVGVPLPMDCEAITDNGLPILGISIDVPMNLLNKLVNKIKSHNLAPQNTGSAVQTTKMATAMLDSCQRLLSALCNDMDADILGNALLEELVYRALLSDGGSALFDLADQEGRYARIASVLDTIHRDCSVPLNVPELASAANMSVSAFHTAFRNVTQESPIQYVKKVRLNRARDMISFEGKRISEAAHLVGYNSASQFSREFKRHFNESPNSLGLATA